MSENDVTKRGRRRKYESNAEKQRAYRQRKAEKEAKRVKQIRGRRVFIDPNKVMDKITLKAGFQFQDGGSWINSRNNWGRDLDRARLPEWIASLRETRKNLNRFIRFLKKL